ncbi:hypothetical protein [Bacillus alkalicellulosilyticus]|uniref:hypothetical protein n=1 Tax=Alkalihalobacterium alkalicellulosilyticum TaxID=1912214 RepID=UPI00148373B5|nr:hypothetical protein [Bacillus alkalicellulosilyticus]
MNKMLISTILFALVTLVVYVIIDAFFAFQQGVTVLVAIVAGIVAEVLYLKYKR